VVVKVNRWLVPVPHDTSTTAVPLVLDAPDTSRHIPVAARVASPTGAVGTGVGVGAGGGGVVGGGGRRRRGGHHHPGGVGDLGGGIAGDHAHGAGGDTAGEAGGAHRGERGLLRGPDEVALRLLLDEARHLRDDGVAHGELARPTDRHRVADHAGREHGEVGADGSGAEVETGGRDGVVGARRESADGQKRRREGETSTHGITSQNRGRSAARRAWHAQRCAGGSSVALRPRLSRGFAFVAPLPGTTRSA
jgi:hypothetical protein